MENLILKGFYLIIFFFFLLNMDEGFRNILKLIFWVKNKEGVIVNFFCFSILVLKFRYID